MCARAPAAVDDLADLRVGEHALAPRGDRRQVRRGDLQVLGERPVRRGIGDDAQLIMVMHPVSERRFGAALKMIAKLKFLRSPPRSIRVIEEEFGVQYHPGHVRKLLHGWGFSVQRPRRVLARADVAAQDRWRRRIYPHLKKKPKRGTGR